MKKILKYLLMATIIFGGIFEIVQYRDNTLYTNNNIACAKDNNIIKNKIHKNENKITIVKDFIRKDGKHEIDLSDGSWAIEKENEKIFEFQPVSMGDWSYVCKSKEELNKCVENYLIINNNKINNAKNI